MAQDGAAVEHADPTQDISPSKSPSKIGAIACAARPLTDERLLTRGRIRAKAECARIDTWRDEVIAHFLDERDESARAEDTPPEPKPSEPRPYSPCHFSRHYGKRLPGSLPQVSPQVRHEGRPAPLRSPALKPVRSSASEGRLREMANHAARVRVFMS